jgi:molybdopterin-containing oxidoreductase family iron-sulfur binding subunit
VYAAYHNPEGINAQIYNRCVGTRYCANNCPYKVRRFNWFDPVRQGALAKMVNPDISTRGRGVMEKCTFCYQRIRAAKDHAKDEGRLVSDGEVIPACAQTCPSGAIHFGNMKDKHSAVYKLSHSKRVHQVFKQLGTHPAVYYLKKKG